MMTPQEKRLEAYLSDDADEETLRLIIEDLRADTKYAAVVSDARIMLGMIRAAAIPENELQRRGSLTGRICDAESPEIASASGDAIMNRISAIDTKKRSHRHRRFVFLALVATVAIASTFWYMQPATYGTVTHTGVGFDLYRNGKTITVTNGIRVRHGDRIIGTADTETLDIQSTDGTLMSIHGKTHIRCRRADKAQHVMLETGSVTLNVRPQDPGHPLMVVTPLARATIVGTTLTLTSTDEATRLDVASGAVLFANLHEDRMIVEAGQHATARRGARTISGSTTTVPPPPAVVAGYNRWRAWQDKISADPDVVLQYDFQQTGNMSGILPNLAPPPEDPIYPRNLDARIYRGTWSDGRFPGLKHGMLLQGNAYLECGRDEAIRIKGPLTCLIWFKPLTIRSDWTGLMTTGQRGWGLQVSGQYDSINFYYHTTEGYENARSEKPLQLEQWHLAVGTFDGTHTHVYLDGKHIGSYEVSGSLVPNPDPLMIGGNFFNRPNRYFQGWVDQAILFKRAITPEEVTEAWIAGKP